MTAAPPRCAHADTGTRYIIGSVSEPRTAFATLRLVRAGKLGLDDTLTKVLPEAASLTTFAALAPLVAR